MRDRSTVEIITLISGLIGVPESELDATSSMATVPQWDSIAHLNLCLAFQERFQVTLDMETIANSTSVAALARLIPAT